VTFLLLRYFGNMRLSSDSRTIVVPNEFEFFGARTGALMVRTPPSTHWKISTKVETRLINTKVRL